MTKGRAVLPETIVAEQEPFVISTGAQRNREICFLEMFPKDGGAL
jgi:hypothetical protein